ncbi:hypothetical protein GCM10009639_47540 [Kitasatospora putterlickiae]|uniref:Uncharacterized protein n=1 Tax=Kitasatospora putterlickiae TaxID=221725 RepID=A0ABP4IZY1_9ACTN
MPKYIVAVDVITVHVVPVLAPTPEAAQAEAERIVTADWETWYDHTEPVCVGDALTEAEWDAQAADWASWKQTAERQAPPPASRPKKDTPAASFKAPRTDHHADGTVCPPAHKHTSSGKPLTEGCTGRAYSTATCTCGWTTRNTAKGYTDETRRRHLATEHG